MTKKIISITKPNNPLKRKQIISDMNTALIKSIKTCFSNCVFKLFTSFTSYPPFISKFHNLRHQLFAWY